jgi:hypothetical protein
MGMIKHYNITKDNLQRAKDWLVEHVSSEDVRWWIHTPNGYGSITNIAVDVTEEEEVFLTAFILTFA